jgi:hypothetical protein
MKDFSVPGIQSNTTYELGFGNFLPKLWFNSHILAKNRLQRQESDSDETI